MDDSGAILCQISTIKDMLDQVNEEIEANFQITREIESEIVKCSEIERTLLVRESELMKMVYELQFEISGLMAVNVASRTSVERLEEESSYLKKKQDEILRKMNEKREAFTKFCMDFQQEIDEGENVKLGNLLAEKEHLENEVHLLRRKISSLQNSMSEFIEEILKDLYNSNLALCVEIQSGNLENEKLVKDINELKTTLLATLSL